MSMTPIPVPHQAESAWRTEVTDENRIRKIQVGPPPGVSDDDCGTVESLFIVQAEGLPLFCDYWRPDPDQLAALAAGGFLELRQYVPQMVMHSLNVWPADAARSPLAVEDPAAAIALLGTLRDQLALAADCVAASPQQLGSSYALQYVVEQMNAILGTPEIPVPDDQPDEPTSGG